jgi:hypothetical protein
MEGILTDLHDGFAIYRRALIQVATGLRDRARFARLRSALSIRRFTCCQEQSRKQQNGDGQKSHLFLVLFTFPGNRRLRNYFFPSCRMCFFSHSCLRTDLDCWGLSMGRCTQFSLLIFSCSYSSYMAVETICIFRNKRSTPCSLLSLSQGVLFEPQRGGQDACPSSSGGIGFHDSSFDAPFDSSNL